MSQKTEIQKLLKKMYTNSVHLEEWNTSPEETTKKWKIEVDEKELETIKTVVGHISNDLEQVQEVRYVNQYTVKKISDMTRHGIFSFYTMMLLQVITFLLGIVVFCFAMYAFIQNNIFLGLLLGIFSFVPILYFLIKKPLQELNENIGNLVQMQVALGAWFNEMTYWQVYAKEPSLEERQMVAQTMRDATKWAVMLIEDYTSHKDKNGANTKTYTEVISKIRDVAGKWKKNKDEKNKRLLLEEKILTKTEEKKDSVEKTLPLRETSKKEEAKNSVDENIPSKEVVEEISKDENFVSEEGNESNAKDEQDKENLKDDKKRKSKKN